MSDCSKCWETPCVCGHEYKKYSPERKQELACSALGITNQKLFTIEDIKNKLLELNPQIKNDEYTNPFLYEDIEKWYNELNNIK